MLPAAFGRPVVLLCCLTRMREMPVARSHLLMAGFLIPGLLYAAPVVASDGQGKSAPLIDVANEPAPARDQPFAGAAIADDAQLARATGREDIKDIQQTVNVQNTSTVSGNTINGDPTTGTISIDGASFGGFNGLALVNANTGNNVSINSSMNVNVAIQP